MNRITQDFKKNLISRYSQREQNRDSPVIYSQPKKISNSQEKFMQLFESINKPLFNPNQSTTQNLNNQQKFITVIQEYSNSPSFIQSVISTKEDELPLSYEPFSLAEPPLILNQKVPFQEAIKQIITTFQGEDFRVKHELLNQNFMDLEIFSTVLSNLGRKNRAAEAKAQAKGKAIIREPTPTVLPVRSLRQIQTDTVELQQQQRDQSERMKKIDLILMELIQEKKRKNYVPDYEAIMQMKLMQLLEFILQDQPQYQGLDPTSKTKQVLKNLESFQGKTIQGESKINLLRIFFEQFTALKKQKQKQQIFTPMKKVENNREKPSSKTRQQTKKSIKQQVYTQQNSHTQKKSAKSKTNQSQKKDEWMGSLS